MQTFEEDGSGHERQLYVPLHLTYGRGSLRTGLIPDV